MSLVMFTSRAAGPFIMFRETADQIFKIIGRPLTEQGAFASDELSEILRKLEDAKVRDKALAAEAERRREDELRRSTYAEELDGKEEREREEEMRRERIHLYQRVVPLEEMIKRAIRHDEAVMWGKP